MNAAPATVFAQVNDFHAWDAWSPWAKLDPDCKVAYEGAASGEGAVFTWDGNDDVGAGKMTITDSRAPDHIAIDLEFIEPWEGHAKTAFDFKAAGAGTEVTWSIRGDANYMCKLMGLFCSMDSMIGTDYEKGLAAMKSIVEKAPVKQ